ITRPAVASGRFKRSWSVRLYSPRRRRRPRQSSVPPEALRVPPRRTTTSAPIVTSQRDPGVQVRVDDIHDEVHEDEEKREDQRGREDCGEVMADDRDRGPPSNPVPDEHVLDEDHAAEEAREQ